MSWWLAVLSVLSRRLAVLSVLAVLFTALHAQKVITRSTMVGLGSTNVLDSYLSAAHFSGPGVTLLSTVERRQADTGWRTLLEHEANISSVEDRSGLRSELEGAYNFYWGRLYTMPLMDNRLTLQVGGVANASLGVIYNTSNSNNPAQARAHLNLMPTGAANYRFPLFGKSFMARYQVGMSLVGLTFSPNYGQSYYEIFSRGNYDHNVVPTTVVSAPEWRQCLTLDAVLGPRLTLRVGYLGNMQQQKVNGLRQHVYSHRLLLGVTKCFTIKPAQAFQTAKGGNVE